MGEVKKPFWEESYKRPGKLDIFYDGEPDQNIVDTSAKLTTGATVPT